jgi:hypothetical protein
VTQASRNTGPEHWPSRGTTTLRKCHAIPRFAQSRLLLPIRQTRRCSKRYVPRFARCPRVVEAWLTGEHLTPENGSPAWDTTDIILLLDPPLPEHDADAVWNEIATLEEQLEATGFRRAPDRAWQFVSQQRFQRSNDDAIKLYTRSNPD